MPRFTSGMLQAAVSTAQWPISSLASSLGESSKAILSAPMDIAMTGARMGTGLVWVLPSLSISGLLMCMPAQHAACICNKGQPLAAFNLPAGLPTSVGRALTEIHSMATTCMQSPFLSLRDVRHRQPGERLSQGRRWTLQGAVDGGVDGAKRAWRRRNQSEESRQKERARYACHALCLYKLVWDTIIQVATSRVRAYLPRCLVDLLQCRRLLDGR